MAGVFASLLSGLARIANNGVSTFSFWGVWEEVECPKDLLD